MQNLGLPLIWIDLEMTGLDTSINKIIEIATIITDSELNIIAEGPELAIARTEEELSVMDNWNQTHHSESGLLERVRSSKTSIQEADQICYEFIAKYTNPRKSPLCGNSIWQDRRFIDLEMPLVCAHIHYRNIDVSTLKELVRRWYPNLEKFTKQNSHRALDDIRESIAELKYYREKIFLKP